jgi:alkylation response protein AidB-like acyl-CoA dehydrogenase
MTYLPKGGSYLLGTTDPENIFTPEVCNDEHRMIAETVTRFVAERIFPRINEIESKKEGLMRELLSEAAELGLLGADIPEEFGGIQSDIICSTVIAEKLGATGSFATGQGVTCSIGNLPIVYFGNRDQKSRYLPSIASAKKITAYALTEPGSGSDALSIKTKAVLSEDGKHYIMNGSKTFISNAGIADIFIVYAKIDGELFSAFIVDGDAEGVSTGEEEKKMGLKGSSTRSVFLDNVKVPVENLLFEPGKGHLVAFNILNFGRHHVSANALGASKYSLDLSTSYANERKQFKVPIAQFGMMKEKLAEMATRIYVAESIIYRNGGLLENKIESLDLTGPDAGQNFVKGIEEYAIECSLEKVFVTEMEAYVVDEGVQIHGGYGFIADYPVERLYRDARIHRIFEGTNEINRNLIVTTLLRRAAKSDFPLMGMIKELRAKIAAGDIPVRQTLGDKVQAIKDVFFLMLGIVDDKYGEAVLKQQETLGRLADIAIQAYASESAWLRTQKAVAAGQNAAHKTRMVNSFIHSALEKAFMASREVMFSLAGGSELTKIQNDLAKLLQYEPIDQFSLRREIAATISEAGKYVA